MTASGPGAVTDSVRLAWPAEAAALAALQRRSWVELLPEALADAPSLAEMTDGWRGLLERPAEARLRVLVALAAGPAGDARTVGYALTLPASDPDTDPVRDGEVDQLVVDAPARGQGHGSRLLNAAVDTLRADGFSRAVWWVAAADTAVQRFARAAGWEPDGARREVGDEASGLRLAQLRLHTDLSAA